MGKTSFDPNGGRCCGNGGRGGSIAGRGGGWLAKRSIVSNEGCGSGGLAVRGGKSSSESKNGEIPGDVLGESGGDAMWVDGGAVCMVKVNFYGLAVGNRLKEEGKVGFEV
ncbi:hypothetical protein Tco_0414572 [Tanacetum coccineum]